jgi:hypothetical protein
MERLTAQSLRFHRHDALEPESLTLGAVFTNSRRYEALRD